MSRYLLALVVLGLSCRGLGPDRLSGAWSLCISSTQSKFHCGRMEVGRAAATAFNYRSYRPLSFELDLAPVLGESKAPSARCGSLLVGQDSSITMIIGIECGVVLAFDGGNLIAEHLRFAGDSIVGEWVQSCFAGCSSRGTLVAKRGA